MTRFTGELRDASDWTAATEHPFAEALGDGSLADERFRRYLLQDHAFLGSLASLVGHAAGQAPTLAAKAELADFLLTLTGPENDYFERAFEALGVPETEWRDPDLHPATRAFGDLLGRAACEGGYAESLAVLVPVEWVYLDWARRAGDPDRWYLAEWVAIHDGEEFERFVGWLRDQLDAEADDLSPPRRERVADLFERAVALEARFFEEAAE